MNSVVTLSLLVLLVTSVMSSSAAHHHDPHHHQHHHDGMVSNMAWRHHLHREVLNLGLTADVTATIEESLFQKICATVVPLINQYAQGLVIPGQSGNHFSYNNVVIQQFDIGSMSVTLNSPNDLQVSLNSISFSIPNTNFDVWDRIIVKISCGGVFWASMSGTSIFIHLTVSESDGRLHFTNAQSSVTWGSLNVGHDFPNFFCKLGNDIIQLFVGNLNNLIEKTVEQDMPAAIGPMVAAALNSALQRVPLDIVSSPQISSNAISVTVDLLDGVGRAKRQQLHAPRRSRLAAMSPRDLELQMSESAVDSLLIYVQQLGMLNINASDAKLNTSAIATLFPTVFAMCPNCPFDVEINMLQAPVVTFGNESVSAAVTQTVMGLNMKAPNGTILPFVDLYVNATAAASSIAVRANSTIYFQVQLGTVAFGLRDSIIGPIDVSLLSDVANMALAVVVAKFNSEFGGVPLPAMAQQAEIDIAPGSLALAFNVLI